MPDFTFNLYQLDIIPGVPANSVTAGNAISTGGNTVLTDSPFSITVTDDDNFAQDFSSSFNPSGIETGAPAVLTNDLTVDGVTYSSGLNVYAVAQVEYTNNTTGDTSQMAQIISIMDSFGGEVGSFLAFPTNVSLNDSITFIPTGNISPTDPNNFAATQNFSYAQLVCFTRDTMIDTDQGEVAVQDLAPGMMVRTRDNGFQPIRWIGMTPAKDRAVRIKAGAMGNTRDLVVSPRHRMMLDGWQLEMLFDHDHALVTALELVNDDTIVRDETADVEYYHVMFDAHEIIYAEGAATESFHPDQPSMGSMDKAAREEIFALFPELRDGAKRPEAAPNLSASQAAYVGKNLDAFVN